MPFGIIGRMGLGMRQVVRFGDRSTGRGTFGGEFGARRCNQWGLYDVRVQQRRDAALFPNYFGQTCYYLPNMTTLFSGVLCYRKSVCRLSVVCNVRASTQSIETFSNISLPFCTLAIL